MRFDPAVALQYATSMAKPRRVGTAANDAVIADLASRLRSVGCQGERDRFEFSSPGETAVVVHILVAQILIITTFWAWGLSSWAGVLPAALLAALLGAGRLYRTVAAASLWPPDRTHLNPWRRWWLARGRHYETANVVAHIPARSGSQPQPAVLLVAHSDSKSQALPLVARMGLIALASLAALVFAALAVLRVFVPAVTSAAALAGLTALVAGVPLFFLFLAGSGNASPGAVDNASGAGLLLHLAECLCAEPPSMPVNVLITGAEELGLLGALAFVQHTGLAALAGARVLNFDGIGTAGRLALVAGRGTALADSVRDACRELDISLGRLPLLGAQFDHLPFADAGLESLTLVNTGRAALSVHTAQDEASKLDRDGFRRAGEVALRVLEKLGR